jgi:hypothetical protein
VVMLRLLVLSRSLFASVSWNLRAAIRVASSMSLWKIPPIAWVVSASASGFRVAGGITAAWAGDEGRFFITRSCQDPDCFPEADAFSTIRGGGGGFPMLNAGTLALIEDVSTSLFESGLL